MRSVMLKHGLWKNLEIFPLSHGDTRVVAAGRAWPGADAALQADGAGLNLLSSKS